MTVIERVVEVVKSLNDAGFGIELTDQLDVISIENNDGLLGSTGMRGWQWQILSEHCDTQDLGYRFTEQQEDGYITIRLEDVKENKKY